MGACVESTQFASPELGSAQLLVATDAACAYPPPPGHSPDSPLSGRGFTALASSLRKADDASDSDSDDDEHQDWRELYGSHRLHLGVEASVHDPRDEGTTDAWVKRNPSLIRLTGKHPFNGEPPLTRLVQHGFITPAPLHYVRNHGPVPRGDWATWTVEVTGLVRRPARLTMEELVRGFPAVEVPVTLVCSSNRRKEQNMVRQTVGFNWGPAAMSTSVWRGARLRDVLRRCGIMPRKGGALNVCFEGADDLPAGGRGSTYGTSIRREWALDPTKDVMLAYMQNGEPLLPDHGFPVRVIVPGCTAGRMVKWLRRIIVTTAESDNYYHYRDNRFLPSHVDAELADAEAWWYKPEYVINEMNTNSVITTPAHDDILPINAITTQRAYTMKGFAYSGGGKKVTRVEVTLNGGQTWLLCALDYTEKPNKYGKYWCWCFWSVEVEVADLLGSKEISVRAWDQSLNTQPENLTWNLMGMMTNCWFKVKVNVCRPHKGEIGLVFEHPVQPGNQSGGWMARQKNLEVAEATAAPGIHRSTFATSFTTNTTTTAKEFTMSEVRKHASQDSAWIVVHGHVYDCTRYLKDHPGGADSILINAGTECTEEFDAIHSNNAKALLDNYRIGKLVTTGTGYISSDTSVHSASSLTHLCPIREAVRAPAPVALSNPQEKVPCRLVDKKELSRDVRLYRFALPLSDHQVLGLPVGKHIFVCANINGKLCMRAYTPTSMVDEVGHFELLVKVYFKNDHPKFPNGGLMTQYLESLPIGSYVDVKGPRGHVEYTGRGNFMINGKPRQARRLAMIAGGSGITPIYQVIQAVLRNQTEDQTLMHLVYANRTEDDILLRDELDLWATEFPDRLKVWYVISQVKRPEEGWKYSVGFVSEAILREHMPEGGDDTLALACGPPPMIQFAISPNLEKMKYDMFNSVIVF
ncbi:nitrate reductase [NADH] 1-like [Phragmites australis]|uniref:nitrate reductase [NADH] 1-like n=1 Tax=Phragmites australis TaxID=29695 RepID=UPI002D78A443|nr:nitrate reductase [NADH] 1-like [Phragmites australis]